MDKLDAEKSFLLKNPVFLLSNQKNNFNFMTLKTNYNLFLLFSTVICNSSSVLNTFFLNYLSFKIKKNNFFLEKLIKKNNFFFYRKKYIFNKNYKFNKFFLLSNINSKKTPKSLTTATRPVSKRFASIFIHKILSRALTRRYFQIVGSLHSSFSWNLQNFRLKNANSIFFTKKNKSKRFNPSSRSTPLPALNLYYKKILLNNFFYSNKSFLGRKTLGSLKLLYFIKSRLKRKNNKLFYKPYSFLNNSSLFKNQYSLNRIFYNNFKKLSKVFNLFKKVNFRNKNRNRLKFPNLFFFKTNRIFLISKYLTTFANCTSFRPFATTFSRNLNLLTSRSKNYPVRTKLKSFRSKYNNRVKSNFFFKNISLARKHNSSLLFRRPKTFFRKSFKIRKYIRVLFSLNRITNYYNKTVIIGKFFPVKPYVCRSFSLNTRTYSFTKNLNTPLNSFKPFSNFFNTIRNSLQVPTIASINSFFRVFANTKTRYKLLFGLSGFLFVTNFSYISQLSKDSIFLMKKNYYTFSQKNDMQKFILKRYLKNKFITTPDKTNFIRNSGNQDLLNLNYSFIDFFSTNPHPSQFALLTSHLGNRKWGASNINELYSETLFGIDYTFSIRRVKFKPGYMTMWRNARETLKGLMSLKFKYQHKLTKYLAKYNKSTKTKTFLILELQLINVILKSKLLPDRNYVDLFLNNNLIYVNGFICNNPLFSLFVGDIIQLTIHNKYYILYRWMSHWNIQKKIRLKTKSKKKMSNQSFNDDKQRSNTFPKWILQNKDIINDCARYLEVDYFTLSAFFIYEPFLWSDLNPYSLNNVKFGIINLYNWKYIT